LSEASGAMKIQIFGSSSEGNCIRIYTDNFPGIYLDAGVSPSVLMAAGAPLANMPFFITHEHSDHSKFALEMHKKFGTKNYASAGTVKAFKEMLDFMVLPFDKAIILCKYCMVRAFKITHYPAAEPVGFIVTVDDERLLYLIDCGSPPDQHLIPPCDIYFIEANYTPYALYSNEAIWAGVRGRTSSGFGHLSAVDAYEFLQPRMTYNTRVIFGHMSRGNFSFPEYEQIIPSEFRQHVTFAKAGMTIDTDPF